MIEIEKAIEDLRQHAGRTLKTPLSVDTVELAVAAMGRQIPQKPIEKHYEEVGEKPYIKYKCPSCASGNQVSPSIDAYCCRCGQALDWSGENE